MWQQNQLDKFIETHKDDAFFDSRSVFLQNPQQCEELDKIIIKKIWPGVERAIQDSDLKIWISPLAVSFTKGKGAGWGLCSTDEAREQIYNVIKQNIAVIDTLCELEKDYSNTRLSNKFHKTVIEAYESY